MTKTLALRPKTFLDYYTDINKRDKEGKPTFGNASRSYAEAYSREVDQTACTNGVKLLRNTQIQSELEQIANQLGEGVKVRIRGIIAIAAGKTSREVKTKQYTYHKDKETGKTKKRVSGETVTVAETRDSDRLKASALLNKMTGLDALTSAAADIAIKESRDLYNRMVRPGKKEKSNG